MLMLFAYSNVIYSEIDYLWTLEDNEVMINDCIQQMILKDLNESKLF